MPKKNRVKPERRTERDSAGSRAATGSAAPAQPVEQTKREWIRFTMMVEDTPHNRVVSATVPHEMRTLAGRFEGKKIVKAEALHLWAMTVSKDQTPESKVQPNDES